jgi:nucleoside-diphosphate-sugar epimerase
VNILVTGGTGFIGGHLVNRLLSQYSPQDICCLVRPSDNPREVESLARLRDAGVRIIEGDLTQPSVTAHVPPAVDLLFHLAANSDTDATEDELRVNDLGIGNLLQWLGGSVRGARIVYASSIAVLDRDHPADGPLNEMSPCVPRTAYGLTKLRGEEVIKRNAAVCGYEYTILRLATVYGPGAKTDGLFDSLFKLTRRGSILGRLNWPGRTSIVHVEDVAAIMVGLAQREEASGETYCIANPDAPTVGELAKHIAHFAPESVSIIHVPGWLWSIGRRLVWNRSLQLLVSSVAKTTAWRLTLIIDDGFWFDTRKLQRIWTYPLKDLGEGLAEMLKYRQT